MASSKPNASFQQARTSRDLRPDLPNFLPSSYTVFPPARAFAQSKYLDCKVSAPSPDFCFAMYRFPQSIAMVATVCRVT